jgi:hypothetical protein
VVVGGSLQTQKTTSGVWSYHLEGTLGYGFKLTNYAYLSGSAGVGERWRPATSGGDLTYYVLRVRADIDLSERWSWNVITYRYRDAFDLADHYNTPEVSTGISFKIGLVKRIYGRLSAPAAFQGHDTTRFP